MFASGVGTPDQSPEGQPAQPVADQVLHPCVAYFALRRQDQHLEHRHRIIRRTATPRSVGVAQRSLENRPKTLEINDPPQFLQRITIRRQPPQMIR